MTGIDPSAGYGYAPELQQEQAHNPAVNWIGAAASLALVIGVSVWGWQTVQRDVSGIPVIKAVSDPMRVRPDDPGGAQADHQGLAVNEVQATGQAAAPVDQLVMAPPPLDLSQNGINTTPLAPPQNQSNGSSAVRPLTPDMTPAEQKAALEAMANSLALGANQLDPVAPAPQNAQAISASVPGVSRSPRPLARPATLQRRAPVQAAPTVQAEATTLPPQFVDPATIPAGTRLVQFGAFDSAEIAQREWTRLSGRFSSFLSDKRPVVQRAISGGREFHRLRVMGFADVSDSRQFCAVFLTENTACIPVVAK